MIRMQILKFSNDDLQWLYGGAFAIGDGSSYDGTAFVQRSVELGQPVIYLNFNYRVNAFGWLAGKEALAGGAANVGLYDRGCFKRPPSFRSGD
jgi:acetylcholinesterase